MPSLTFGLRSPRRLLAALGHFGLLAWCACGDDSTVAVVNERDQDSATAEIAEEPGCSDRPVGAPCDDGNACTLDDRCNVSGQCTGESKACTDPNLCLVSTCNPATGECEATARPDGTECSGSLTCFEVAWCEGGTCKGEPASAIVCGSPTADEPCVATKACKPGVGCVPVFYPETAGRECDADDDPCTIDRCKGDLGCQATGDRLDCSRKDTVCQPNHICINKPDPIGLAYSCVPANPNERLGDACPPTDPCHDTGTCERVGAQVVCVSQPLTSDVEGDCWRDYCEPPATAGGAAIVHHDPLPELTLCAGACGTTGRCDTQGRCVLPDDQCCADSDCQARYSGTCAGTPYCISEGAEAGRCGLRSGTAVACAPATDACKTTACDESNGECKLVNRPDGAVCDDASACTTGDQCVSGACVGTPKVCADTNVCTTDTCDPATGCKHTDNTASCSDNNTCTAGDMCSGGACAGTWIQGCCNAPSDCPSGVCLGGQCQAARCDDRVQNQGESDEDCGGPCPPCQVGDDCDGPEDCVTQRCVGGTCQPPLCQPACMNGGVCVGPNTCDCTGTGYIGATCMTPRVEICDGIDNTEDDVVDEGCNDDGDGFCDLAMQVAAPPPSICTSGAGDFDDLDEDRYPGAPELCDNKDNDNDSVIDNGFCQAWAQDIAIDGGGNVWLAVKATELASNPRVAALKLTAAGEIASGFPAWFEDYRHEGFSSGLALGSALRTGSTGAAFLTTQVSVAGAMVFAIFKVEHNGTVATGGWPLSDTTGAPSGYDLTFDALGNLWGVGGTTDAGLWKVAVNTPAIVAGFPKYQDAAAGEAGQAEASIAVAVDAAGAVWAAGKGLGGSATSQQRGFLMKYDTSGNTAAGFPKAFYENPTTIGTQRLEVNDATFDSAGNLWVVGYVGTAQLNTGDWMTWKFTSAGDLVAGFPKKRDNEFGGGSNTNSLAFGVTAAGAGQVWVVGSAVASGGQNVVTVFKLDANGTPVAGFPKTFTGPTGASGARKCTTDAGGNLWVAGHTNDALGRLMVGVWKVGSDGTLAAGFPKTWAPWL